MSYESKFLTRLDEKSMEDILLELGFAATEGQGYFHKNDLRVQIAEGSDLREFWDAAKGIVQYMDFSSDNPSPDCKKHYRLMRDRFGEIRFVTVFGELIDEPEELR